MRRARRAGAVLLFTLLAISCASSEAPAEDSVEPEVVPSAPDTTVADGATRADRPASYIFDQNELRTYELVLSEENLAFLDEDPTAEEYVDGTLRFEGEEIGGVGIRYKGSIGAFVGCLDGPNMFEPSGAKVCTKLSMKVKINHTDPDLEFFGQRKLQFHAMNLDPTQMRERLGYHLFREMGAPAPRAVHARLLVNGEFVGVFALVEQIDGRFTRANFDDGTGNLYKEVWPTTATRDGVDEATSVDQYRAALKTNEDDPSFELISRFADEIVAASSDDAPQVLDSFMEVDELIAYAVVDRTIRHDDGPFHFYCDELCTAHNFYLFENPATGKLHLIAWDLDNAFENIRNIRNPVTRIPRAWDERQNDCESFQIDGWFHQRSAACDPVFGALIAFEDDFVAASERFIEGPFAEDRVDELLEQWGDQIRDSTEMAENAHPDALTTTQWERSLDDLRRDLAFARSSDPAEE